MEDKFEIATVGTVTGVLFASYVRLFNGRRSMPQHCAATIIGTACGVVLSSVVPRKIFCASLIGADVILLLKVIFDFYQAHSGSSSPPSHPSPTSQS